jgi:lysophospholipase L1-like esterase
MRRFFSLFFLVLFNIFIVFLFLEVGVRVWLYSSQESFDTFMSSISDGKGSTHKRKITAGNVTLGRLIRKSAHSGRVYEFMPDIEATYLGEDFETNSFGMRDREIPMEKPPGVRRVVGIGDSVMFGWGVSQDDSYLRVVEKTLQADSQEVHFETLNFAVPGYNTAMEVATYEDLGRRFSPDVVVLHFVDNDLGIPLFMSEPLNLYTFGKSYAFQKINDLFKAVSKSGASTRADFVGVEFEGKDATERKQVIAKYQYMLGHEGFNRAMAELSRLVCEDEVPVVILTGRLKGDFEPLVMNAAKTYGFHVLEAYPVVNAYVENNQIENTPEARKKLLWLNDHDPHPNVLGHQLYADTLVPFLKNLFRDQEGQYLPICN